MTNDVQSAAMTSTALGTNNRGEPEDGHAALSPGPSADKEAGPKGTVMEYRGMSFQLPAHELTHEAFQRRLGEWSEGLQRMQSQGLDRDEIRRQQELFRQAHSESNLVALDTIVFDENAIVSELRTDAKQVDAAFRVAAQLHSEDNPLPPAAGEEKSIQIAAEASTMEELQKDRKFLLKLVQEALDLPIWETAKNLQMFKSVTKRSDLRLPEVNTLELYTYLNEALGGQRPNLTDMERPIVMALLGKTLITRISDDDRKNDNVVELVYQFAVKAARVYADA